MKILHVITSLKIGGAESALYNLLSQFAEDKEDQHYVAYFYDGPNVEKIKKLGIPVFKVDGLIFRYDFFAYFKLKKLVKKISPDVIHSALWAANFLSRIISGKLQIPIICDLHSNFLFDGKLRIFLEKYFLLDVQKYVAVSTTAKDGFLGAVVGKLKNEKQKKKIEFNICTIPNGIDVEDVRKKSFEQKLLRSDIGLNENDFVVGAVGRLEPIKGYDLLIRSFAELLNRLQNKNIRLCIIGDGSQRVMLEKLATKLGLSDHIIFLGEKDSAYGFYSLFDCFVLSSSSEGLSIALLEALCFGLPIISTNKDKNHDVIIDGQNGFLVPPNDIFNLANAIQKLYLDCNLCKQMKLANLNLVKEKFNISSVKDSYNRLYRSFMER